MLSIVTISQSRPDIFKNHLESLFRQNFREETQLVIIDDSLDGDMAQERIIKEFLLNPPWCQGHTVQAFRMLNRPTPGGVGRSLNFGIKQTTGQHIAVLCGDDLLPEGHFTRLQDALRLQQLAGCCDEQTIIGWPLFHLKPGAVVNLPIRSIPFNQGDQLLRGIDISPEWSPGPHVWYQDVIDDRMIAPRSFFETTHGWLEGPNSNWWRDAQFRILAQNNGYRRIVDWSTFSLHQFHPHVTCAGDQAAKDFLDNMTSETLVTNEGDWGQAEYREI